VKVCFVSLFLVVITGAVGCLERFLSRVTYYVSEGNIRPCYEITNS